MTFLRRMRVVVLGVLGFSGPAMAQSFAVEIERGDDTMLQLGVTVPFTVHFEELASVQHTIDLTVLIIPKGPKLGRSTKTLVSKTFVLDANEDRTFTRNLTVPDSDDVVGVYAMKVIADDGNAVENDLCTFYVHGTCKACGPIDVIESKCFSEP